MGFIKDYFNKDYSKTSLQDLHALKAENERRAREAEAKDQRIVDHMPVWLNMTNTTRCNLRCFMCNQAYGKTKAMSMEPEIYDLIVKQFFPFLKTVQLSAIGEPMMTPGLPSKIDDMLSYGVKLEMVTNGTLLKGEPLLEKLAEVSELITVSLDGATSETFNSIREGADFDTIIHDLERFNHYRMQRPAEDRPVLDFNYILMKRNIRELPAFIDLAADLGARKVICSHLVLYEKELENEMLIHTPELSNAFTRAAMMRAQARGIELRVPPPFEETVTEDRRPASPQTTDVSNLEADSTENNRPEPSDHYLGERCYFLWTRVYIGPHGEVVPCCLSGIHAMGSLKDRSFPDIWNCKEYQIMRGGVHTPQPPAPCDKCYLINRNPSSAEFRKV